MSFSTDEMHNFKNLLGYYPNDIIIEHIASNLPTPHSEDEFNTYIKDEFPSILFDKENCVVRLENIDNKFYDSLDITNGHIHIHTSPKYANNARVYARCSRYSQE